MSNMQLSPGLVESVQNAVITHDGRADASGILIQYLAAIIGYVLANEDLPSQERRSILEQLNAFSLHVLEDVEGQATPEPPKTEAFGIWKADKNIEPAQ